MIKIETLYKDNPSADMKKGPRKEWRRGQWYDKAIRLYNPKKAFETLWGRKMWK